MWSERSLIAAPAAATTKQKTKTVREILRRIWKGLLYILTDGFKDLFSINKTSFEILCKVLITQPYYIKNVVKIKNVQ